MRLIGSNRFSVTLNKVAGGGIHKARNNLAHEFLTNTNCERMLMVDSDMSFEPEQVARLWAHDADVIGGPYCHKKDELSWSARAIEGITPDPVTKLQELSAVGTGFLMIKRGVFQKMIEAYPEQAYIEDWNEGTGMTKWDFFQEGVVTDDKFGYPKPTYVTEDFYFCLKARRLGFKVLVDTTFYLKHWEGMNCYPKGEPGQPPKGSPMQGPPRAIELQQFAA